jgi:hypothetical protein
MNTNALVRIEQLFDRAAASYFMLLGAAIVIAGVLALN